MFRERTITGSNGVVIPPKGYLKSVCAISGGSPSNTRKVPEVSLVEQLDWKLVSCRHGISIVHSKPSFVQKVFFVMIFCDDMRCNRNGPR